ncbi:MAG: hypothetical protein ACK583_17680 [Cyanobacteriota bacterium]
MSCLLPESCDRRGGAEGQVKDERCQGDDPAFPKLDEMHVPRDSYRCLPN